MICAMNQNDRNYEITKIQFCAQLRPMWPLMYCRYRFSKQFIQNNDPIQILDNDRIESKAIQNRIPKYLMKIRVLNVYTAFAPVCVCVHIYVNLRGKSGNSDGNDERTYSIHPLYMLCQQKTGEK